MQWHIKTEVGLEVEGYLLKMLIVDEVSLVCEFEKFE